MLRTATSLALVLSGLLGLATRARASCLACPNCVADYLPSGEAVCLNYWTCSEDTITCYYPSVEYPGTFTACAYTLNGLYFYLDSSSPSVCGLGYGIGDNPQCQPSNNPWNGACTSAEQYVGEGNSALL